MPVIPGLSGDLSRIIETAISAADRARELQLAAFGQTVVIEEKDRAGLVSEVDRESERRIVNTIRESFAGTHDDLIWGEEGGAQGSASAQRVWFVDPLDGTTNFLHGLPMFCISIGVEVAGVMKIGLVDAPALRRRYLAAAGLGAFVISDDFEQSLESKSHTGEKLASKRLSVSTRSRFRDGLFATGFSANDHDLDQQLELLSRCIARSRGVRRAGAAALDLCWVAEGAFDVFWERHLQPWDTAAGALIAREAGAAVTDFDGQPFDPRMSSIVAGNPVLQGEILALYRQIRRRP